MAYTVKQLAEISGVSVRTLHWYDEVDLLKPAYYGANGYRYYEEEELLMLQQILFFRELGFKLDDIKKVLDKGSFDKIKALYAHRSTLEKNLDKTKQLIKTIDKTISHLRGKKKMKDKEFYAGFDMAKQKEYEQYLTDNYGSTAENLIQESKKRTASWGSEQWASVKEEGDTIYRAVAESIDKKLDPTAEEVQAQVEKHVAMTNRFYEVTKEVYMGLADLYCEHTDFRKFFEAYHPNFVAFFAEAMREYAKKNLS